MAISILQTPATASLGQSPIIFSVTETSDVITSSSFQFIGELYYWTGSTGDKPSTSQYTVAKYPNNSDSGIFDFSRILNSTLTDTAQENTSSVYYYSVDFYPQWVSGSTFKSGSVVSSNNYRVLDGYSIFQEAIGEQLYSKTPHWPILSDGPATQSYFDTNGGRMSLYGGDVGFGVEPQFALYTWDGGSSPVNLGFSTSTGGQIKTFPIGPEESDFPSISGDYFTVQGGYDDGSVQTIGSPIRFELKCEQKYPNVRIKWKNRFGAFDYFNFNMVKRESFSTTSRTYQPQIGSWDSTTLSYNDYDSSIINYINDSQQTLSVNTDWISEDYNEIFKQLLVSEEIYWITDETTEALTPLTIKTQNIDFKTGVVDKLIQYEFEFDYGQGYKLIL